VGFVTLRNGLISSFQSYPAYLTQWQKNGQGLMAHNGLDVGVKLRPVTQGDFDALGEEFQDTWKNFYEKAPDKALMWSGMINAGKTYERRFISSCYFTVS